ncbi:MAG: 50S ribosome-binding GTPase [Thermogutta sp.]|uniref:GTPase family protein n=1 Tax=Thermogutta sp. TaxID=1962930 RepID=UPI00198B3A59|nr:GTPase [Thermogutta sp.]MBC7353395.1 50S ribosome-binding GTPase [Thermogutta sp.]
MEQLALRAEAGELSVNSVNDIQDLLLQLMHTVARHFYPDREEAYLQVPVTDVLKIIEEVTRELRETIQKNIPVSHILTINDWIKLRTYWESWQSLYIIYRIVTAAASPINALWREFQRYVTNQSVQQTMDQMKCEALAFIIRRVGFYLIELYSGRVVLDEEHFEKHRTTSVQEEWKAAQGSTGDETVPAELIRIVIVGQLKAGKSSLVNALCGAWRAHVDVLPATNQICHYRLIPEDANSGDKNKSQLPGGLILVDTPGYQSEQEIEKSRSLWNELERADMVVIVCSARIPARRPDRIFVQRFRQFFRERPFLCQPPLIAVCSFIDELRPRHEWNPPYNWQEQKTGGKLSKKEEAIRDFVECVRRDLELTSSEPAIPVCTHPDRLYNVKEGVLTAIRERWPEAQGVQRNRLLRQHRGPEKWRLLREQAKHILPHVSRVGVRWLTGQLIGKLGKQGRKFFQR